MNNINLNVGGLIGAIVGLGAAIGVVVALSMAETGDDGSTTVRFGLGFPLLFGGAYAGNFLWAKFVSKPDPETNPQPPAIPDDKPKS